MEKTIEANNQNKVFGSNPKVIGAVNTVQKTVSLSNEDLMRVFANLMIDHILLDKNARLKLQPRVSNI